MLIACEKMKEEESQECYLCNYSMLPQESMCDDSYTYEVCVSGPHEASLQDILVITKECDGQTTVTEDIAFLEEFLAVQQNQGAVCEKQ